MRTGQASFQSLLLYLLILLMSIWFNGCSEKDVNTVKASELLIRLSEFPPGWDVQMAISAESDQRILLDQNASDFAVSSYIPPGIAKNEFPKAGQIVWRFSNQKQAQKKFRDLAISVEKHIENDKFIDISYRSEYADEYDVYCGINMSNTYLKERMTKCSMIGQYGKYIITFTAPIGEEYGLSLDQFQRILQSIDQNRPNNSAEK